MPKDCVCEPLWTADPAVLLKPNLLTYDLCESNNINAFTRALILSVLLSILLMPLLGVASLAIVLVVLLMLYGRWLYAKVIPSQRTVVRDEPKKASRSAKDVEEGFLDGLRPLKPSDAAQWVTSPAATINVTKPTPRNPFMNVLLDEIKYNPTRPSADFVTDPNNAAVLDDFFRIQWNSDPTDVFGRNQSQREFYTMPSTSIPNDQGSFQNWLYLIPGKTCKEGGRDACYPGTNGGPVTWLNDPN